jgi:hypothetical protein
VVGKSVQCIRGEVVYVKFFAEQTMASNQNEDEVIHCKNNT